MALRIAICEDEPIELRNLHKKLVEHLKKREMPVEFALFEKSSCLLSDPNLNQYDVVFLDIDMPDIDGIEVANRLRENSPRVVIIFVTNRDDLVFQAIKHMPFRFLRKCELDTELTETINALQHKIASEYLTIELPSGKRSVIVEIKDVICFTSIKHSVYAVLPKERFLVSSTMKILEDAYAQSGFIRIHSSYLVNYKHIYTINRDGVTLENGDVLPISRHRIAEARNKLHFFIRKW